MIDIFDNIINTIKQLIMKSPFILAFICAQLSFLIARSSKITIILKNKNQRTNQEKIEITQGLKRSILLEMILFIPASLVLFYITIFPLLNRILMSIVSDILWCYAVMGIAAYGFPFATIREFVKRTALKTLKEFAEIAIEIESQDVKNNKD